MSSSKIRDSSSPPALAAGTCKVKALALRLNLLATKKGWYRSNDGMWHKPQRIRDNIVGQVGVYDG